MGTVEPLARGRGLSPLRALPGQPAFRFLYVALASLRGERRRITLAQPLRRRTSMLEIDSDASDLSGVLDDGSTFTLSQWRGLRHVVLYFYLKDFTKG